MNMDMLGLRNGVPVWGDWLNGTGGMEVDSLLIPMPSDGLSDWPYIWGMEGYRVRASNPYEPPSEAGAVSRIPFVSVPVPADEDIALPAAIRAKYLTQVEVAFGLGLTVRLGLGLGDLLDFGLGWTTLDILGDDWHPLANDGRGVVGASGLGL